VRERESECEGVRVCLCEKNIRAVRDTSSIELRVFLLLVCVCVYVCACMNVTVCVCVCERERVCLCERISGPCETHV